MAEKTSTNLLEMNEEQMWIEPPKEKQIVKPDFTPYESPAFDIPRFPPRIRRKVLKAKSFGLVLPSPKFYSLDFSSFGTHPNVKPSEGVKIPDLQGKDIGGPYNVTAPYFLGSDGNLTLDAVEIMQNANEPSRKRHLEEEASQVQSKKISKPSYGMPFIPGPLIVKGPNDPIEYPDFDDPAPNGY